VSRVGLCLQEHYSILPLAQLLHSIEDIDPGLIPATLPVNLCPCCHRQIDGIVRIQGQPSQLTGGKLTRRRYQKGTLILRGKRQKVWVGRWLHDEIRPDNTIHRRHRSEVLGNIKELPTRKLALRVLESRLTEINSPNYRPTHTVTFAQFAEQWESMVLPTHKPSSQCSEKVHLRRHLRPKLNLVPLKDIDTVRLQKLVSDLKGSPKTVKNIISTLRCMWGTAKAWALVTHNPFDGLKLPKPDLPKRRVFSVEEVKQIIAAAQEPHRTFFWLAAETGMRIGELCGLRKCDIVGNTVRVQQSAWNGKLQTPKSANATRVFAISLVLAVHLKEFARTGIGELLFATKKGKPWDARYIVRLHLRPILDELKIERAGIHAFRHFSATLMDQLAVPLKAREARLGHSSAALTLRSYTHLVSADDEQFAAKMGEILCPDLPQNSVNDTNENDHLPDSVGA
jgi:integrase